MTPDIEDHNYKILLSVSQEIKSTHIHICAPPSNNYVFISACAALSEFSVLYESTMSCCKHIQLLFFCSIMLQKRSKTFFTKFKETLHIAAYWMVPIVSNAQGFIIILIHEMRGPGSVVGIATAYGLDGPGIESRWGEIFYTCPDWP